MSYSNLAEQAIQTILLNMREYGGLNFAWEKLTEETKTKMVAVWLEAVDLAIERGRSPGTFTSVPQSPDPTVDYADEFTNMNWRSYFDWHFKVNGDVEAADKAAHAACLLVEKHADLVRARKGIKK